MNLPLSPKDLLLATALVLGTPACAPKTSNISSPVPELAAVTQDIREVVLLRCNDEEGQQHSECAVAYPEKREALFLKHSEIQRDWEACYAGDANRCGNADTYGNSLFDAKETFYVYVPESTLGLDKIQLEDPVSGRAKDVSMTQEVEGSHTATWSSLTPAITLMVPDDKKGRVQTLCLGRYEGETKIEPCDPDTLPPPMTSAVTPLHLDHKYSTTYHVVVTTDDGQEWVFPFSFMQVSVAP